MSNPMKLLPLLLLLPLVALAGPAEDDFAARCAAPGNLGV
jgi:hypothetical protein